MERERQRADDLDRSWDAIQNGQPIPAMSRDDDADLTELIARLHAASPERPLFSDPQRAWEAFKDTTAWLDAGLASTAGGVSPVQLTMNGRVTAPIGPRRAASGLRPFRAPVLSYLATAALLVLALIAGLVAAWQRAQPDEDLITVSAVIATPDNTLGTPVATEITEETLFTTTFTAGALPEGEIGAVFYRLTLAPGSRLANLGGLSCGCTPMDLGPGVGIELVESGEYTIRLDAPMQIQRGGGSPETEVQELAAGTEIALSPGDAAIYSRYDAPGDIRNSGSSTAVVMGVAIVGSDGAVTPPVLPEGVQGSIMAQTVGSAWDDLPAGPVTVTLRQVTLLAEMSLGPYETAGLEAFQLEEGRVARSFLAADDPEPRGRSVFNAKGTAASALAAVSPGTRRIITNLGDEPAVLLVLTIEPASNELT